MSKRTKMKIEGIDCPTCAVDIENNIKKIDGIVDAKLNFLTENLRLEYSEDIDETELVDLITKASRKIERKASVVK